MEEKEIHLLNKGEKDFGKLLIFDEAEEDPDLVKLVFIYKDFEISVTASDFFSALQTIRRKLEPNNIYIICNGASKNVYPSPMIRNMGNGSKAYILTKGHKASNSDIVDIFEKTIVIEPSSVDEQNSYYEDWLKTII